MQPTDIDFHLSTSHFNKGSLSLWHICSKYKQNVCFFIFFKLLIVIQGNTTYEKKKSSQNLKITDLIGQTFRKWPGREYKTRFQYPDKSANSLMLTTDQHHQVQELSQLSVPLNRCQQMYMVMFGLVSVQ